MVFEDLHPSTGYHFCPCWHCVPSLIFGWATQIVSAEIQMRKSGVNNCESEYYESLCVSIKTLAAHTYPKFMEFPPPPPLPPAPCLLLILYCLYWGGLTIFIVNNNSIFVNHVATASPDRLKI